MHATSLPSRPSCTLVPYSRRQNHTSATWSINAVHPCVPARAPFVPASLVLTSRAHDIRPPRPVGIQLPRYSLRTRRQGCCNAPRSQHDDVDLAVDPQQVAAVLMELARREQHKNDGRIRNKAKSADRRKAKQQQLAELRATARDITGLTPKEYRQKIKEFRVLLPDTKEHKLLSQLDPESLKELLLDSGSIARQLMQLSSEHPQVDISLVATRWPLLLTRRHRTSFLLGHTAAVHCAAADPDARTVLTGGSDAAVRVWDLDTGSCTATMHGHTDRVLALAVAADGSFAVSGSADSTLRVWDLASHTCVGQVSGPCMWMLAVALLPGGRQALTGSVDGDTLCRWALPDGACLDTLLCGHSAAAAGRRSAAQRQGFPHASAVHAVAVSSDGRRAVSAGTHLLLWELRGAAAGGVRLDVLLGPNPLQLWCAAMTPDGRWAVVGCSDASVRVWDLERRRCAAVLEGHTGQVLCVAAAPDCRHVVSGSGDASVRVWDLDAGACCAVLEGHLGAVRTVAVTADGRRVLSGGDDLVMRVWDLQAALSQQA